MGADYSAYALVGLKVDPDKLKGLSSCEHEKPASAKFCHECGKPAGVYDESSESIAGYEVIWGTDHRDAYICAFVANASDYASKKEHLKLPTDIEPAKEKMKNMIGPLGLWDEKLFGLWAVLYCSY